MNSGGYFGPASITEALELAGNYVGDVRFIAGGTDLLAQRKQGHQAEANLIDLSGIEELRTLHRADGRLLIGAGVTLEQLQTREVVSVRHPLLAEAAAAIATPVIRKSATVGGNLLVNNRCTFYNQSREWRLAAGTCLRDAGETCLATGGHNRCYARNVSDLAAALIVLSAEVMVARPGGGQTLPLEELYQSDGMQPLSLPGGSWIITGVSIPDRPARHSLYRKLRLKQSMDFTSLTMAAAVDEDGHYRICFNGVSMAPVLLNGGLAELRLERLLSAARKACQTVNNDLMALSYRREAISMFMHEWHQSIEGLDGDSQDC